MEDKLAYYLSKVISELKYQIVTDLVSQLDNSISQLGTPNSQEKLLKADELCAALSISESQFYKMKKNHKNFPAYDFHGAKRYKQSDVQDFFKQK